MYLWKVFFVMMFVWLNCFVTQPVTCADLLSGASSVESIASNASLPGCVNGSVSGAYTSSDQASNRGSCSQHGENEVGRISCWAVSFDRLLDDHLGILYFKVNVV